MNIGIANDGREPKKDLGIQIAGELVKYNCEH